MKKRNLIAALVLSMAASSVFAGSAFASTDHFANSQELAGDDWDAYTKEWETVSADYTKVAMNPGKDETELNFAWMTPKDEEKNKAEVLFGTDKDNLQSFEGTVEDADAELTGDPYVSNKVTVTGLEPETTYYYQVIKNGEPTDVQEFTTKKFDDVKMLFVGDPQIGASKGQPQGDGELVNDAGAANTAARNDAYAWNRTLNIAETENPDINFIISAGDQVNKTGQAKEEEFAGYLNADALKTTPVATTIGNHDSLCDDYAAHFFVPNATQNGATAAGGDYYYSYGDGLFIVLNTNNYNVAEHEATMKEATESDPDAKWRIVTLHQDIYGSGADHSETDGMILRTQLTPIFDSYDVDVVLQGHDHTYSRTKMLQGDGQTHDAYEFQLNADGTDYDWDHAHDTTTDTQIALYPEEGDQEAADALAAFQEDNKAYTIDEADSNTVTNPEGILYMTSNSASGSKYYELLSTQQDYIAARSQNWLPSYSVIELTADKFTIDTYQIKDDGTTEKIDDTFTIEKQ